MHNYPRKSSSVAKQNENNIVIMFNKKVISRWME